VSLYVEKPRILEDSVRNIHADLIDKGRRGDETALEELYRLYCKAMYNTALRIVIDRAEAEDILQESFITAFHNLKNYREEATFGAWLKRIVVNKSLNVLRKRSTIELSSEFNDLPEEENGEDQISGFPFSVDQVKVAIAKLPDGYRTVLTLYLLEGYDHSEISHIMNIDENTSKSQLSRAKKKLLEILETNKRSYE